MKRYFFAIFLCLAMHSALSQQADSIFKEIPGELINDKIVYLEKRLDSLANKDNYAKTLLYLGVLEDYRGDYKKATTFLLQSLSLYEALGDIYGKSLCNNSLGRVNHNTQKFEEAIEYYQRAFTGFDSLSDYKYMAITLNNLGSIYLYEKPEKAKPLVNQALNYNQKTGDLIARASILTNLAVMAWQENAPEDALAYDQEVLAIYQSLNDQPKIAAAWNNIAYCYRGMHQFEQAKTYALQSLELSNKINARPLSRRALINLSTIYASLGDFREGYHYARQFIELNDSLTTESNRKQLAELQVKYESEKQEKEIALLNQQKALQSSQIRSRNLSIGLLAILVSLFAALAWIFYQRKKFADQQILSLEQQKNLQTLSAMVSGQEQERSRIARDLHDGLGALLSSIRFQLSNLSEKALDRKFLAKTDDLVSKTAEEVRRIAHNMVPGVLLRFGLIAAVRSLCESITASGQLTIQFQSIRLTDELKMGSSRETMIYRIVQELIQNVLKHAEAQEVLVQLAQHDQNLEITIEDDGKGFNPEQIEMGLGLSSIKARVSILGGLISIQSEAEVGTSVLVYVPLMEQSKNLSS